jgi:predicted 3-demethylubiquinone-9 3-methyltransferase (glyoxalase superfamily)
MRFLFVLVSLLHVTGCQTMPPTQPTPAPAAATKVSTFLMFQDGKAQQAMSFYASVFAGSHVVSIERYGPGQPGPEGTVKVAQFDLNGHRLMFSDSFVKHAFTFTPSVSLFVDFASAEELDAAFTKLAEGGQIFMPLDNYGFSRRFGWCSDRFGVSWQLNLPETTQAATRPTE